MTPEVSWNCMPLTIARDIWANLYQTYFMKQNISICYEMKTKNFSTKQAQLSVTDYYEILNGLWIELDQWQNPKIKCSRGQCCIAAMDKKSRTKAISTIGEVSPKSRPKIWVEPLATRWPFKWSTLPQEPTLTVKIRQQPTADFLGGSPTWMRKCFMVNFRNDSNILKTKYELV